MASSFTIPPPAEIALVYKHGRPHGSQFGLVMLAIASGGHARVDQTLQDRTWSWSGDVMATEMARLVDAFVAAAFPNAPRPVPRHPPGVLVPGTTFTTLEVHGAGRASISFPSHEGPAAYNPILAMLDEIVHQVTGGRVNYGVRAGVGSWVTGAREL